MLITMNSLDNVLTYTKLAHAQSIPGLLLVLEEESKGSWLKQGGDQGKSSASKQKLTMLLQTTIGSVYFSQSFENREIDNASLVLGLIGKMYPASSVTNLRFDKEDGEIKLAF